MYVNVQFRRCLAEISLAITVKPVLSDHLKIDKAKVVMGNDSLMEVESIADYSHWKILLYF